MDREMDDKTGEVTANSHNSIFTSSDSKAGQSLFWCVGDSYS